jgi:hypothetical protein
MFPDRINSEKKGNTARINGGRRDRVWSGRSKKSGLLYAKKAANGVS